LFKIPPNLKQTAQNKKASNSGDDRNQLGEEIGKRRRLVCYLCVYLTLVYVRMFSVYVQPSSPTLPLPKKP